MIAGFSDGAGRRPAYIFCFVVYIGANIGLALQRDYAALMVLRCLQSAGSSGTVALVNGVVADLVTSSERGMYIAYTSVTTIGGPLVSFHQCNLFLTVANMLTVGSNSRWGHLTVPGLVVDLLDPDNMVFDLLCAVSPFPPRNVPQGRR